MSLPKPPGWKPAATAEEALALTRARWSHEPIDFEMACEDVGERVAIMYEHLDEIPEYSVHECSPAVRIFRRVGDGWLSAYAHTPAEVQRVIEWLEDEARKA